MKTSYGTHMFKKGKKKVLIGVFVAVLHKIIQGANVEHASPCRQPMEAFAVWRSNKCDKKWWTRGPNPT